MRPLSFMLIAGEPSGDRLAAELVRALREECARRDSIPCSDHQPLRTGLAPRFFGAGGPQMAGAGVDLALDLTRHSVVGLWEVLRRYGQFRRLFQRVLQLACDQQPDALICVDFSGFNRRLASALQGTLRNQRGPFNNWRPRIIQYVSPQVWASRPGRAHAMARDLDLLLSIFPFERDWYAQNVPGLRVQHVGHPIIDQHGGERSQASASRGPVSEPEAANSNAAASRPGPLILLLPGSRSGELRRHLPVMVAAARLLNERTHATFEMVLPEEKLVEQARPHAALMPELMLRAGGLAEALARAKVAIASTGTVMVECAYFGVPTVAMYQTSWGTYQIAKRIVRVPFLAMPNLLAGETLYPEFIQEAATPENLAREALDLLRNQRRRATIQAKLAQVVADLGPPGASRRAAQAVLDLLKPADRSASA